jgi:hypothetical protein
MRVSDYGHRGGVAEKIPFRPPRAARGAVP